MPNPTRQSLRWRLPKSLASTPLEVDVINASGQRVHAESNASSPLDVSTWPVGTYELRMMNRLGRVVAHGTFVVVR
jgi:hypothetical protein